MKILIVANGEPPSAQLLLKLVKQHDRLVAVDGGLNTCVRVGLSPNLLIGDCDSYDEKYISHCPFIEKIVTMDQNKSDLEKAVDYLLNQKPEAMTVCGALGRRVDHTQFNLNLLCRYPQLIKFESDYEVCYALNHSQSIECSAGQMLSLIPISSTVQEVFSRGLKWELEGIDLHQNFMSLSNRCLNQSFQISFKKGGTLLLSLIRSTSLLP